jgi:hypothetical protein
MPTDAMVALAYQTQTRREARPDFIAILLGSVSLWLANLAFALVSPEFASAVALIGEY